MTSIIINGAARGSLTADNAALFVKNLSRAARVVLWTDTTLSVEVQ